MEVEEEARAEARKQKRLGRKALPLFSFPYESTQLVGWIILIYRWLASYTESDN